MNTLKGKGLLRPLLNDWIANVVVNKLHSFEKGEKGFRKEVAWP